MEKLIKKNVQMVKPSVHQNLKRVLLTASPSITFIRHDGSKIIQSLSDSFINNEKNKRRELNEIVNDIFAIQNDLNAKYFIL